MRNRARRLGLMALVSLLTPFGTGTPPRALEVVFADHFDAGSRGERQRNTVVDAPPAGMGYTTDVPFGFSPKRWIVTDPDAQQARRGFWCIPERANGTVETFMIQAGRSHNSIAYAGVAVPASVTRYIIEFRQWANDNDYIGYIVGASGPAIRHDGAEFGYERQLPGTDTTSRDMFFRGALGTGKIVGGAAMRRWALHRIEVDGEEIRWFQDGIKLAEGRVSGLRTGGYFGIRHRYDRGSRYDDVVVSIAR